MKKTTLIALALLAAGPAAAQYRESHDVLEKLVWNREKLGVMLDTRLDLSTNFDEHGLNSLSFNGQTLKVWFAGEIVPGVRYRVRHRLNRPQTPLERDNLSGATDHAWVAFDLGPNWTITAGKQSVQLGTFEYDYNPADIYLGTEIYNDFDGYKTGVDVAWKFLGQTLHAQIVNSDSPQFASPEYGSRAMAGSVLWEGHLFDGALDTRWGYSAFQHTGRKFYQWVTAGAQLDAGGLRAELDYYLGDRMMDYTATLGLPTADTRHVRDQSASLNLEYTFDKWRPFVKAVWSERRDQALGAAAYYTRGIQAVAEYYPFRREETRDLRFHAAWMYSRLDFSGPYAGTPDTDTHTLLVGMRWLFKVK